MKILTIFLLLFGGAFAYGQTYTTVTGTVTDAHGMPYVNGAFNARLDISNSAVPTTSGNRLRLAGSIAPYDVLNGISGDLDNVGAFSVSLVANGSITPASTHWLFTICAADKATCFSSSQTISGTSQSLTTALSAAALAYYTLNTPAAKVGLGGVTFNDGTNQNTAGVGTSNLTGPITSVGAATAVAPTGVIAQKPVTSVAVLYAAPLCAGGACSDSNDGLSWGTAKLTAMAAYDALPSIGGTVYFADSTVANAVANTGIYLMASGDPNYASPPAGWRHVKTGSISFVGVFYGGYGVEPHMGRARLIAGGNSTSQPGIWMNGDISTHFENLAIFYPGRGVVLGECSNGLRDGSCPATNIVFDNVSADTTGVNAHTLTGPAFDITGASFWIWLTNCSAGRTDSWGDPTSDTAASILLDGSGNSGVGLIYILNTETGSGPIKFKQGGNGGGLFVENVVSESLHGPATVWFDSFSTSVQATIKNVTTSDPLGISTVSGTATVTNGSANVTWISGTAFTTGSTWVNGVVWLGTEGSKVPYGILSVTDSTHLVLARNYAGTTTTAPFSTGNQYNVANTDTNALGTSTLTSENAGGIGPMDVRGYSVATTSTTTPLQNRQVGFSNGRVLGQGDWAARGFAPVSVRFGNLAAQVTSGTGVTTAVTDPAGGSGAITYAPASLNAVDFYSAAYTPTLNDWIVAQIWVRATSSGGFQGGNTPARFETISSNDIFAPNGGSNSNCTVTWIGNGDWKKLLCVGKVIATDGAATVLRFRALADGTSPTSYFAPMFIKLAAGTISDAEVWELAQNLGSYDSTCVVGTVCGLSSKTLHSDFLQITPSTVAALGTCNAAAEGTFKAVNDAAATPVYNATAANGGSVHIPVYCNGTNWVNH